jgi:HK97 family phage portal protein
MQRTIRKRIPSFLKAQKRSDPTLGTGGLAGVYGFPTLAGSTVSNRTALGIAAVWQAVQIYCNAVAGLDLYVAQHDERGGQRPAREHPVFPMVATRPNPITTSFSFRQSIMLHALTRGNGYAEIERNDRGKPVALHLMEPTNVEARINPDGDLCYRLHDKGVDLESRDVIHIRGLGWNGITGYSAITLFRETLGLAIAEREHASGLMGNSATPGGHIEFPGKMTDLAKATFRGNWNSKHQGPKNAGNFGILDNGARWVQTSFSPADSELLLSREFSIAEVARIFNLPQHMLGLLEHASVGNIEEQNIQFYQLSLLPWLRTIEQELNSKLFGPIEQYRYFVTHDAASVLRGNLTAQTAWVKDMFGIGMLSRNEGRMRFSLPPVEGGDAYYIPTNNLTAVGASTDPEPTLDPDGETQDQEKPDPSAENPKPLPAGAID